MSCGFNCCSEVFIELTPQQREQLEREKYFIQEPSDNLDDLEFYRWLKYHDQFAVQHLLDGRKKIIFTGKICDFKYNSFLSKDILYVDTPCKKLNDKYFCTVYGNRPKMCRLAKCPAFDPKNSIRWYGTHGKLKQFMKK